jgi:hypothetical protein
MLMVAGAGARWAVRVAAILLVTLLCSGGSIAYSVFTHEEIVDLVWTDALRPLLLIRFPALTENQLKEAHGYAYGGAVIQDLDYYPFGSVEFSNLVHYVRSGDFVRELLAQSQDANEYAFALGRSRTMPPTLQAIPPSTKLSPSVLKQIVRSESFDRGGQ